VSRRDDQTADLVVICVAMLGREALAAEARFLYSLPRLNVAATRAKVIVATEDSPGFRLSRTPGSSPPSGSSVPSSVVAAMAMAAPVAASPVGSSPFGLSHRTPTPRARDSCRAAGNRGGA
jgi:hypothetical protein